MRIGWIGAALLFVSGCSASDGASGFVDRADGGLASGTGGGGMASGGGANVGGAAGGAAGSTGAGGALGPTLSTVDLWHGLAQALCHHMIDCPGAGETGQLISIMTDETGCTQALQKYLLGLPHYAALNAAVTQGILRVNGSVTDACFKAAADCDYPDRTQTVLSYELLTPCREMFEGKVPIGGDCTSTEECSGEAFCRVIEADGSMPACVGSCVARYADGGACSDDRECSPSSSSPDAWPICSAGKCETLTVHPATNGACGITSKGQFTPCSDGLMCGPAGSCMGLIPAGGACDDGAMKLGDCASASTCVDGFCKATAITSTVGGPCEAYTLCNAFSNPPLGCSNDYHCVPTSTLGCQGADWFNLLSCPAPTLGSLGDPCTAHAQCGSGLCGWKHGCVASLCSKP